MNLRLSLVFPLFLLAACAVGPDYSKPDAPVPPAFKEAGWKVAEPKDTAPKGKWWEVYGDPVLNSLVEQVEVSNFTLKSAEARYRQARAAVDAARSQLYPDIGYRAGATRVDGRNRDLVDSYSAGLDAGWVPDLWGRIRRNVEANRAAEEASAADLAGAKLALQAQLATTYFSLRVTDAGRVILDDTVKAFQTNYDLTQNRYRAGVAAKADVVQSQQQLLSVQSQVLDIRASRASLEHAIAVLIGKAPADFTLEQIPFKARLPDIPVGLPTTLLERRPDIAAAERRMAVANAQIGIAQAAYFPDLTLSASAGTASATLGKLFDAQGLVWSVGAQLAGTLFDFGARSAQVESARAGYDASVSDYRSTVLTGFQEVEDNLATIHWLGEAAVVQEQAVRAARESVALTVNQYKAGTASFLAVALVQASQLSEERTMVQLMGRQLSASVALIRSIGGEW
ncbi:Outer membrane protein OprM [Usitatibacter rugosus]|uniref:Outer membrane protein OprM n=1 Tax=Usitatibacter rugosus TaxID=2732067 RepID=A0A6M4GSH4_9PROT|nr:efflux transporter outer membrane subunit [Usitatibacter rugosus]QJR09778.1 Outer membrane protein OprM [Usitatibacter rugosus]